MSQPTPAESHELDSQSMRRLDQLWVILRLTLIEQGPDAEVVVRVRKRGGRVSQDSAVEHTSKIALDGGR